MSYRTPDSYFFLEFETSDSKKYKVKAIWDSAVYVRESKGYLPRFY